MLKILVSSVFAANDFYVGVGVSNKFDKFGAHEKELFDGYTNHLMSQVPSGASYTSSKTMGSSNKMTYDRVLHIIGQQSLVILNSWVTSPTEILIIKIRTFKNKKILTGSIWIFLLLERLPLFL